MDAPRKSITETGGVSSASAPLAGVTVPTSGVIGDQLRAIAALGQEFSRHLGGVLDVNPTDLLVMQHVMMDGPLTPSELARRLHVSTAATTISVDRLVAVGHAHREPHPGDRRKVVVVPEPSSVRHAIAAVMPVLEGLASATGELTDSEADVVSRFLDSVIEVYRSALDSDSGDTESADRAPEASAARDGAARASAARDSARGANAHDAVTARPGVRAGLGR